jgi:predicted glycosyltransferase
MVDSGINVIIANGGMERPGVSNPEIEVINLPPVKSDSRFSALYDSDGEVITDEFKRIRCTALLQAFEDCSPDMVLIESYPFGRRQLKFELVPLLQLVTNGGPDRPCIACSVRDVIQPKSKKTRVDEIIDIVNRYFDYIFVHGDRNLIDFGQTFPDSHQFREKIVYTGYVAKSQNFFEPPKRLSNKVLVSAGGGVVGKSLYDAALAAASLPQGLKYNWHILVGENLPEEDFQGLLKRNSNNTLVERNQDNFIDLLRECTVSISQAGYNTMMDIVLTDTPAIVVPFELNAELEQITRASYFERLGLVSVIRESELGGQSLIENVTEQKSGTRKNRPQIKCDGAHRLAEFISNL